jgi:hypothetical protein
MMFKLYTYNNLMLYVPVYWVHVNALHKFPHTVPTNALEKKRLRRTRHTKIQLQNINTETSDIMGKGKTGTKHHCVGHKAWIGDISPGGCREVKVGNLSYCGKHEMSCRNGCKDWYHLKNQPGCMACTGRQMAEARRERTTAEKGRVAARMQEDQAFWNPERERRKG